MGVDEPRLFYVFAEVTMKQDRGRLMRVVLIVLALACSPASISQAQPWPAVPPRIGQLSMPQIYWDWTLEAAQEHGVSP